MSIIDLRSDTVTRPTRGMIEAMATAPLGDDVYAEDPTVNELEETVAAMLGKEAALFVPTGVMSNQLCLKVLTSPGDEVIIGANSHIFNYETGAPAFLSGIQLHTVPDPLGCMDLESIDGAVREEVYYLSRTSAIALEQTHNREGGSVIPLGRIHEIARYARLQGIPMHLDGARIWNACMATGIAPREYAESFDTISVCLSKGLGAPVGSVMSGTREHVAMARKFRKIWGGGWRQAGVLAAAGLYALRNNVERLVDDHLKAAEFARLLDGAPNIEVLARPQTNIVLFAIHGTTAPHFSSLVAERGVRISAAFKGKIRVVFHMDVSLDETVAAAGIVRDVAATLEAAEEFKIQN